jgi:hypothetical protein
MIQLQVPMASHVEKKKCKKVIEANRVKDSEELDSYDFLSDKDLKTVIPAKPIASCPPPGVKKNRFDNYGLDES